MTIPKRTPVVLLYCIALGLVGCAELGLFAGGVGVGALADRALTRPTQVYQGGGGGPPWYLTASGLLRAGVALGLVYVVIRNREALARIVTSKGVKAKLKWAGHTIGGKRPSA